MKKFLFLIVSVLFLLVACSTGDADTKDDKKKSHKLKASNKMKNFKIGQVIDADSVDVKLDKVEYVNNYDEYSAPENGKAVKVYLKFKNNNDDQVLMDSSDFSMKVKNENYEQWYGNEDSHDGFTHQLNKGNTGSGYITYDVPDSENYTLEMDASPKFANVKAKWEIKKSDIKGDSNANNSTNTSNSNSDSDAQATDTSTDDEEDSDSESDEITFTAEEYNDLVDEYNSLTDGEKMDHVTREVTEIEYTQLEERIEKLYEQQADDADKEYQKEMDEIDKQEKEAEEQQAKEDKEFEEQQEKEEQEYQKELDEEAKQEAEDEKTEKEAEEQQEKENEETEEQL